MRLLYIHEESKWIEKEMQRTDSTIKKKDPSTEPTCKESSYRFHHSSSLKTPWTRYHTSIPYGCSAFSMCVCGFLYTLTKESALCEVSQTFTYSPALVWVSHRTRRNRCGMSPKSYLEPSVLPFIRGHIQALWSLCWRRNNPSQSGTRNRRTPVLLGSGNWLARLI